MTWNWTRRERSLLIESCASFFLLAFIAAPAFSQQIAGNQYFPPVGELLGQTPETLPSLSSDFRDSLNDEPSFNSNIRALQRANARNKKAAIRRLGYKGNIRAVPYLGAILLKANEDTDLRAAAALALGSIGDWRAMTYLKQSVFDVQKEVRFAGSLALGKIGTLDAVSQLEGASMRDTHWWIRFAGAVALGETKSPSAVPALAKALNQDVRWQVRQQAARSLGQIGNPSATNALGRALQDEDSTIRFAAARALGDIGGLTALEYLHQAYAKEKAALTRRMLASSIKKATGTN